MSSSPGSKKTMSNPYDFHGSAAQRIAVESLKNIANVTIGGEPRPSKSEGSHTPPETAPDPDLDAVVNLLRNARSPLSVADVAGRLQWDSNRAAGTLSRGGGIGRLVFSVVNGRTLVALAEQGASVGARQAS